MKFELSVQEIADFANRLKELGINAGIPRSKPGIIDRAQRESWTFTEVPGKGGRGGLKKIYTLPNYVIEELKEKGVLDLLVPEKKDGDHVKYPTGKAGTRAPVLKESIYKEYGAVRREKASLPAVPLSMRQTVNAYPEWAARQNTEAITPVRYYSSVFASAGPGSIVWEVETEAMWFRTSFFDHLGIPPDRCFCTRIKGDSMFPTIIDRGTVLWQATAEYLSEGIYLFRQGDELRVKRLQKIAQSVFRVVSDNPNKGLYPTFDLDLAEADEYYFEIYGRYLWDCGISN
ncbi:S24 family peptidase [Neisseria bacilliformis]|uniref:S24 family peptidase n=1 Tax=Neisseria bacilliformis TaxID=267212 RepID=UPI00069F1072|nr:S24 family peptidase [Neisseria bacilliformis]